MLRFRTTELSMLGRNRLITRFVGDARTAADLGAKTTQLQIELPEGELAVLDFSPRDGFRWTLSATVRSPLDAALVDLCCAAANEADVTGFCLEVASAPPMTVTVATLLAAWQRGCAPTVRLVGVSSDLAGAPTRPTELDRVIGGYRVRMLP